MDEGILVEVYAQSIIDAMRVRGTQYLQLDKKHMIEALGSVTNGLVFYHDVFVRISKELGLKFVIQTTYEDSMKFEVYWQMISSVKAD